MHEKALVSTPPYSSSPCLFCDSEYLFALRNNFSLFYFKTLDSDDKWKRKRHGDEIIELVYGIFIRFPRGKWWNDLSTNYL